MQTTVPSPPTAPAAPPPGRRRWVRGCAFGCAGLFVVGLCLLALLLVLLARVPRSYPLATRPIPVPTAPHTLGGGLTNFDSPYLGHTGSWDGQGGTWGGGSKIPDLDRERNMGLHWTFMPVYWSKLEPDGPVDPRQTLPAAWRALDSFVIAAHDRRLNILMQAPVVGGNAGGPPRWAGRRQPGMSAPDDMDALVAFAGKLADRYRPGGDLARQQGWGNHYGVRAWELDNEPESYRTHWQGQAGDYAEFVTRAARRIKAVDPEAVIVGPGMGGGRHGLDWLTAALNAPGLSGSPAFRARQQAYSIGPALDVVSLHNYEGLDSAFSGAPRTIGQVLDDVSGVFNAWEERAAGFTYARKQVYWHTEGNFDFVGLLSAERRAAWRFQFFTRAFAAGLQKVVVMDASPPEQIAVRAYVSALPNPFPMLAVSNQVAVWLGSATAFFHPEAAAAERGGVWVAWAEAGTGPARLEIPVHHGRVTAVSVDGRTEILSAEGGRVRLELQGDPKMPPPRLLLDRPAWGSDLKN